MKFKMLFFFGIFFLCYASTALAQGGDGKVELIQDPLISILQQKRLEYAQPGEDDSEVRKSGTRGTVLGFRIQIYTGPSRSEAYAVQAKFQRMYSDISTYISYTQPNYRVKVGDFRSRSDAQALMRELRKDYTAVFLFTEQVNVIY